MADATYPGSSGDTTVVGDPRVLLADYANESDEWVRYIVADVLVNGASPSETTVAEAYDLFRQEKALDERVLPAVPKIATAATEAELTAPLSIVRLSDGVYQRSWTVTLEARGSVHAREASEVQPAVQG